MVNQKTVNQSKGAIPIEKTKPKQRENEQALKRNYKFQSNSRRVYVVFFFRGKKNTFSIVVMQYMYIQNIRCTLHILIYVQHWYESNANVSFVSIRAVVAEPKSSLFRFVSFQIKWYPCRDLRCVYSFIALTKQYRRITFFFLHSVNIAHMDVKGVNRRDVENTFVWVCWQRKKKNHFEDNARAYWIDANLCM